ncbi:MAG: glucose-6-phosphate dehydrogenase [Candidatus Symbiobacter sp.]|nr:glucose-6-phosphate dehydrogenase [Candidatus Symbiobacter sp.]
MTSRIIAVEKFDLIVFGASGDLSARKLFPALYRRHRDGQIPDGARIIALARSLDSAESFTQWVRQKLQQFITAAEYDEGAVKKFLACIHPLKLDVNDETGWPELKKKLKNSPNPICAFYLAVAPDLFGPICDKIAAYGLVTPNARLVVEKPLGRDGQSARAINDAVGKVFQENQIFRIDHYLGKETVQNLMALRFANGLFEPLWNSAHIDHVQITVAETLGLEARAAYYDHVGALRDMVQNHIVQLMCLVAMEPPRSDASNDVRDEKLKVLRALKPITAANVEQVTVRGQYRGGVAQSHESGKARSYVEELGSPSNTETFAAIKAEIQNWRWAGVPFYLRTGKRLTERCSEIIVTFRAIPHSIFGAGNEQNAAGRSNLGTVHPNRLVLRLQPDEGVKLWVMLKDPGPGGMRLSYMPLDMSFSKAFGIAVPDAYERLLMDVVRGNQTLFMRRDEVEAAWDWVDPILEGWSTCQMAPKPYPSGSWGPSAAIALIERDGRSWYDSSSAGTD